MANLSHEQWNRRPTAPNSDKNAVIVIMGQLKIASRFLDAQDCHVMGEACRNAIDLLKSSQASYYPCVNGNCERAFGDNGCDYPGCKS
jgi:hypothetical protein